MPRRDWLDLPDDVRREVERHTGDVRSARSALTGSVCDLAAILHTATGPVFCKGGESADASARLYRNEARFNRWLPAAVPRLRWTVEQSGWLLLGFEYAPGHHPDLAPGSPDLDPVADLLGRLARELTPCPPVNVQPFTQRWRGLIDPASVDGDTLLHTDMTPRNFLLGDRLRIVDWSAPCRGAAWLDTAFMVVRLIRAGHEPAAAEAWAARIPAWADASEESVDAFTRTLVHLRERQQRSNPAPHLGPLLDAARRWNSYRSGYQVSAPD